MKRILSYDEIVNVINQEDMCGCNNLLQEIFSFNEPIDVIGEFNDKNELGKYEVKIGTTLSNKENK